MAIVNPLTVAMYAAIKSLIVSKGGQAAIKKFGKAAMGKYREMRSAQNVKNAKISRDSIKPRKDAYTKRLDPASAKGQTKSIDKRKAEVRNLLQDKTLSEAKRTALRKRMTNLRELEKDGNKVLTAGKLNKGGLLAKKKPSATQKGLKKLPTAVRNKMGYMNKGGMAKKKAK